MDIIEWILVVAILDGPVVGLVYILWRRFKNETK
tara:strand:- start:174 stop:275 length:102 start_codon:yes stop_codon:yes gene_type:complete